MDGSETRRRWSANETVHLTTNFPPIVGRLRKAAVRPRAFRGSRAAARTLNGRVSYSDRPFSRRRPDAADGGAFVEGDNGPRRRAGLLPARAVAGGWSAGPESRVTPHAKSQSVVEKGTLRRACWHGGWALHLLVVKSRPFKVSTVGKSVSFVNRLTNGRQKFPNEGRHHARESIHHCYIRGR